MDLVTDCMVRDGSKLSESDRQHKPPKQSSPPSTTGSERPLPHAI